MGLSGWDHNVGNHPPTCEHNATKGDCNICNKSKGQHALRNIKKVDKMNSDNGVIRIGRKGKKKFAFGDGDVFEVDIVTALQEWEVRDDSFRPEEADEEGRRNIPMSDIQQYQQAAVDYVKELSGVEVTVAEAFDFLARLREQYNEVAENFLVKSSKKPDLPDTSEAELRFSVEGEETPHSPSSTN